MFDKETKKIASLTVQEIILCLADFSIANYQNFGFPRHKSISLTKLREENAEERRNFFKKVSYLLKKRMIRKFVENKKEYIELTKKGKSRVKYVFAKNIKLKRPEKWDGKWRMVIFDVSDKKKIVREALRSFLKRLGFHMLQESVFVYPFDIYQEVKYFVDIYFLKGNVKYLISEIIEGEEGLIAHFLKEKILIKNDLKIKS